VTARRLLAWDQLDRRRRGAHPWVLTGVAGLAGAAALVAVARSAGLAEAAAWWRVACVIATAVVAMSAPWRFYWRPDAPLLARLPLEGHLLYQLGAARTALAGLRAFVGLALAAAPVLAVDAALFGRACLSALAGALAGALYAPPAAVTAGVLVASERAQRAFDNMTGAGGAPSTVWLSLVPAAAGVAVGALPFVPLSARAGILAGGAVLWLAALPVARRILSEATREVSALDRVRLAHVELDRARGLERAVVRLAGRARPIAEKDVALSRRRHPAYYLLVAAAVIAMWIVAFAVDEPARARWTLWLALGIVAYAGILAWRLRRPPIEQPRLLATLPFAPGAPERAKLIYAVWRAVAPVAVGLAPYLWRL
jgi:hypothetical protein